MKITIKNTEENFYNFSLGKLTLWQEMKMKPTNEKFDEFNSQ